MGLTLLELTNGSESCGHDRCHSHYPKVVLILLTERCKTIAVKKLHLQRGNKLAVTAGISELHDGSPEPAGGKNTWSHPSEGRRSVDVQENGGGGEMKQRWENNKGLSEITAV